LGERPIWDRNQDHRRVRLHPLSTASSSTPTRPRLATSRSHARATSGSTGRPPRNGEGPSRSPTRSGRPRRHHGAGPGSVWRPGPTRRLGRTCHEIRQPHTPAHPQATSRLGADVTDVPDVPRSRRLVTSRNVFRGRELWGACSVRPAEAVGRADRRIGRGGDLDQLVRRWCGRFTRLLLRRRRLPGRWISRAGTDGRDLVGRRRDRSSAIRGS
jgi:hypothetical protein